MKVAVLATSVAMAALPLVAQAGWPEPARTEYKTRCAGDMQRQGWTYQGAFSFCECMTEWMERQDYNALMAARPNHKGTGMDRALARMSSQCKQHFPPGIEPSETALYTRNGKIKTPPKPTYLD